jgi:hypothetical protein
MIVKVVYCLFLALLVVLFVAWAAAALYPLPTWEGLYPHMRQFGNQPSAPTPGELQGLSRGEQRTAQLEYRAKMKAYQVEEKERESRRQALTKLEEERSRSVALLTLLAAVVATVAGLLLAGRVPVIAEGLLLGGMFTLIYSISFSFMHSPRIAVIPVGIGLALTLVVGYRQFARRAEARRTPPARSE